VSSFNDEITEIKAHYQRHDSDINHLNSKVNEDGIIINELRDRVKRLEAEGISDINHTERHKRPERLLPDHILRQVHNFVHSNIILKNYLFPI